MTPPPFATDGGDIILRVTPTSGSPHCFRVHKLILSLASPVFKDMFTLPQPPNSAPNQDHITVDISDSPDSLDTILRLIYPGVERPKIDSVRKLTAALSMADKYDITSLLPTLREALKTFLPAHAFEVYVTACRFGFSEEAKEAARVATMGSIAHGDLDDETQQISNTDLLRLLRFVQTREEKAHSRIKDAFDWEYTCDHCDQAKDLYFRLANAVEEAFILNPCIGTKDLFPLLDKIPDPPPGCRLSSHEDSAESYPDGVYLAFECPLRPMSMRRRLSEVVEKLRKLNEKLLEEAFGKDAGGS